MLLLKIFVMTIVFSCQDQDTDVESQHQGTVMEKLGERKGELSDMVPDGNGRVKLDFNIPARGEGSSVFSTRNATL
jgi:GTP-binding protein